MLTFHELLLSVLLIQINDDRPRWLLGFSLLAHHKTLLHGQQAIHLVAHQQNSPVFGPLLDDLGSGHRCSAQSQRNALNSSNASNKTKLWRNRAGNALVLVVEDVDFERTAHHE